MRIDIDAHDDFETQAHMTSIRHNRRDGYKAAISRKKRDEPQEEVSRHLVEVSAGPVDNTGPFSTAVQATSYIRVRL